jgi:hypothetical protein
VEGDGSLPRYLAKLREQKRTDEQVRQVKQAIELLRNLIRRQPDSKKNLLLPGPRA